MTDALDPATAAPTTANQPGRLPIWRRLLPWVTLAYACGLVVGTHLPPSEGPDPEIPDKVLHFGAYLGFGWLLAMSLLRFGRPAWWAIPALLVFGAVDELTQIPVGRTADFWDWLADAAGIALGAGVVMLSGRPQSKNAFRGAP